MPSLRQYCAQDAGVSTISLLSHTHPKPQKPTSFPSLPLLIYETTFHHPCENRPIKQFYLFGPEMAKHLRDMGIQYLTAFQSLPTFLDEDAQVTDSRAEERVSIANIYHQSLIQWPGICTEDFLPPASSYRRAILPLIQPLLGRQEGKAKKVNCRLFSFVICYLQVGGSIKQSLKISSQIIIW